MWEKRIRHSGWPQLLHRKEQTQDDCGTYHQRPQRGEVRFDAVMAEGERVRGRV
jgi:hypothetical protein